MADPPISTSSAPAVSILMPFLDPGPYIGDAIASVQAQTFADWELLLIDDGTRDGSLALAQESAETDPRISVLPALSSGPLGPAAARNRALSAARGPLVAFLDADDLYEPGMIARHVELMARFRQAAMVYGPTYWWHPDDPASDRIESMGTLTGRLHEAPSLLISVLLLCESPVPCTCAVTIRSDILRKAGGFDETFRLYEDQTAWAHIMLDYPVYIDDANAARYRQHSKSVSARASAAGDYYMHERHPARFRFLQYVDSLAREHPHEARIRWASRKARWRMQHQGRAWYRAWRRLRRAGLKLAGRPGGSFHRPPSPAKG